MAGRSSIRFTLAMVVWSWWITEAAVHATVSSPPVICDANGCILNNAYTLWNDRIPCKASRVVYPVTESDILAAVGDAARAHQKMKVATVYSHSIPKIACPGSSPSNLIISTRDYNRVLHVDPVLHTITAQSGITWRSLLDQAAEAHLAINVAPFFDGITLGGSLANSVHGSSLWGLGGAVHEYVVGMRVVTPGDASQGYAQVRDIGVEDPDLLAVRVNLGVLGVVSTVTLQAEPIYKRRVEMVKVEGDEGFSGESVREMGERFQYGEVIWYPGVRQVVYKQIQRVALWEFGDGRNDYVGLTSSPNVGYIVARSNEEIADTTNCRSCKCTQIRAEIAFEQSVSYGFKNHSNSLSLPSLTPLSQFPVVGYPNVLQSSGGCQRDPTPFYSCSWDARYPALVFFDGGAALPLHHIDAFIADIKSLRARAPDGALCVFDMYTGFLFRFTKQTQAYLGTAQGEDAVMLDYAWSRSRRDVDATKARLDMDVFQEIEQLVVDKYGGRPHWGKNRNLAFDRVWEKYPKLGEFLAVKQKFDPEGLFSSEWSDAILGIRGSVVSDAAGCAVEGNCRCSRDEHCARGSAEYSVCSSGLVYNEARVCR